MAKLTLAMNTATGALSQYMGLNFNSACEFDGKILLGGDNGLLEFGDVQTDAGTAITATIGLPPTTFNTTSQKRLRRVYLAGSFSGEISLTVTDDGDNARTYAQTCLKDELPAGVNFPIGRDGKGRYFALEIQNSDEMYLDSIFALVNFLDAKVGD